MTLLCRLNGTHLPLFWRPSPPPMETSQPSCRKITTHSLAMLPRCQHHILPERSTLSIINTIISNSNNKSNNNSNNNSSSSSKSSTSDNHNNYNNTTSPNRAHPSKNYNTSTCICIPTIKA